MTVVFCGKRTPHPEHETVGVEDRYICLGVSPDGQRAA